MVAVNVIFFTALLISTALQFAGPLYKQLKSKVMKTKKKNECQSSWIIGGTTMLGLGVGFILLKYSVMYFLASLLIGIAVGLVIAPFVSEKSMKK